MLFIFISMITILGQLSQASIMQGDLPGKSIRFIFEYHGLNTDLGDDVAFIYKVSVLSENESIAGSLDLYSTLFSNEGHSTYINGRTVSSNKFIAWSEKYKGCRTSKETDLALRKFDPIRVKLKGVKIGEHYQLISDTVKEVNVYSDREFVNEYRININIDVLDGVAKKTKTVQMNSNKKVNLVKQVRHAIGRADFLVIMSQNEVIGYSRQINSEILE